MQIQLGVECGTTRAVLFAIMETGIYQVNSSTRRWRMNPWMLNPSIRLIQPLLQPLTLAHGLRRLRLCCCTLGTHDAALFNLFLNEEIESSFLLLLLLSQEYINNVKSRHFLISEIAWPRGKKGRETETLQTRTKSS
jgi:hypothetical protein